MARARLALRNLIERITTEPRAEGPGLDLLVHGQLAQILHITNGRPDVSQGGPMIGAAAGAGHVPKRQKAPEGADCFFGVWLRGQDLNL